MSGSPMAWHRAAEQMRRLALAWGPDVAGFNEYLDAQIAHLKQTRWVRTTIPHHQQAQYQALMPARPMAEQYQQHQHQYQHYASRAAPTTMQHDHPPRPQDQVLPRSQSSRPYNHYYGMAQPAPLAMQQSQPTRPPPTLYCICQSEDGTDDMIACDDEGCPDAQNLYHWSCVGIEKEPDEQQRWICPACQKRTNQPALSSVQQS